MHLSPLDVKDAVSKGLLSFPVTDFDENGQFHEHGYRRRLEWLSSYDAAGLFVAGGTGEFFSIGLDEYGKVVRAAVDGRKDGVPIIAGIGYGTRMAVKLAEEAEAAGADGVLVLPHYLTEAPNEGIYEHLRAICSATNLGVIYYARANSRLPANFLARLADEYPNFIGYKDGIGDIQNLVQVVAQHRDRLVYIGGLPTAEIYAQAYLEIGVSTYSSAVFNFVPELALRFYKAVREHDQATISGLIDSFYLPLVALRDRKSGYAVSMIKAGVNLVGSSAGPVRSPLTQLAPEELDILAELISVARAMSPRPVQRAS